MRLAADLRNAAIELSARRGFLDSLEADLRVAFAEGAAGRDGESHSEAESAFDDAESSGSRAFTDTDEHDRESVQSSLDSSPFSKPLVLLPVEVGRPLDFDIDEVVRHASLSIHGYHQARVYSHFPKIKLIRRTDFLSQPQDYRLNDKLPPTPEPGQYVRDTDINAMQQGTEIPLRRPPLPIPEPGGVAQLARFGSTLSHQYGPQIPQLSIPPELTPISHSAPASPSAGSLMLSFWNTGTGHGIDDGNTPIYASPPSFGQAAPLLEASLGLLPSLRRTPGDNSNDPNQLFSTPLVPLTKTAWQRARGPRPLPLPPKPVPHQQSTASLFKLSPAGTQSESRLVAPPPVERVPQVDQPYQRPLPTLVKPSLGLPSRHGGIMEPGPAKSASYATPSFSSTAQPPGSIRYGPNGDWGWKPPPTVVNTSQAWRSGLQSSVCLIHRILDLSDQWFQQSQNTSAPNVALSNEVGGKMGYPFGHRPRRRSLTSIVDRSKGAVSVAPTTESAGGNYGAVKTTDPVPPRDTPQPAELIREWPRTPSPRRPAEDLPLLAKPIQHYSKKAPLRDSIGFALAYQSNPLAACSYSGASSSGSSHAPPSPPRAIGGLPVQDQKEPVAPPPRSEPPAESVVPRADVSHDTEMIAIREMFYGAVADALSTPALRNVLVKDPSRAYFSAVSLAILSVATDTQMPTENTLRLPGSAIQVHLHTLPSAYRACMAELGAIGGEARKMGEEDDDRAIAYVARGKPLSEPRMGRVKKLLERGVGYVDAKGRVRGGTSSGGQGTGRSRLFANRINRLSLDIVKLPGFHQRQEVFRILQGSR